jgi:L-ascorbate metabolism protein UlaG (beta-lactamase superfamily)
MNIRRLGWAGIELTSADTTIVIDLLQTFGPLEQFVGPPREPLPAPSRPVDAALVTHLHDDHTDPTALAAALVDGGVIHRPARVAGEFLEVAATLGAEKGIEEHALATREVAVWDTLEIGPFTVTAVPAVDGFGDPQISWVVEADGQRILHAGDTVFHGSWWNIASRVGPIDFAFLPINGAVCDFPHRQPPSPLPAVLNPEQAAVAAHLLRARLVVPIHYGAIHHPPLYAQVDDPVGTFLAAAEPLSFAVEVLPPGAELGRLAESEDLLA